MRRNTFLRKAQMVRREASSSNVSVKIKTIPTETPLQSWKGQNQAKSRRRIIRTHSSSFSRVLNNQLGIKEGSLRNFFSDSRQALRSWKDHCHHSFPKRSTMTIPVATTITIGSISSSFRYYRCSISDILSIIHRTFIVGPRRTLLSWKGSHRHPIPKSPTMAGLRYSPSTFSGRSDIHTVAITSTKRTFFSDSIPLGSSSRFSPLEEFLMDVIAWTVAISLWYIPRMEFGDDRSGEEEGDTQEGHLEYREDYGPSVSQWPSTPTSSPGSKRTSTSKNSKPKEGKPEE